jgi:hypothetical protein
LRKTTKEQREEGEKREQWEQRSGAAETVLAKLMKSDDSCDLLRVEEGGEAVKEVVPVEEVVVVERVLLGAVGGHEGQDGLALRVTLKTPELLLFNLERGRRQKGKDRRGQE